MAISAISGSQTGSVQSQSSQDYASQIKQLESGIDSTMKMALQAYDSQTKYV